MLFKPVYMSVRPKYLPPQIQPPKAPAPLPVEEQPCQKEETPKPIEHLKSPSPVRPLVKYVDLDPEPLVEPPPSPPEEPKERLPMLISGYKFQTVIPPEASRDVLTGKVPYIYFNEDGMQIFKPKHVLNALKLPKKARRKYMDYSCVGGHERSSDFPMRYPVEVEYDDEDEDLVRSWIEPFPVTECFYRLYPFIY
ncbi:uncharacterized protein LOC108738217 [Agrilus planipennis]|uniref:Uncharacterized protein LOC108738217 n=1 Tax=Agrilus planipennis TaxID=224129 RepID=A0A7F5RBQ5_AGRPL|nr:uncharacterized protein LOC108738217 [Agrilus planipennis]